MATQWRSEQDRDRAGAPRSRPFQPLAPHRAPPQFKHPLVERRGSSPSGLRLARAEARGWVWPPAGSATCVGVKSTPSEQSVASPRGSGVSARRAAWATLPPLTGRSRWAGGEFSDSCAVSPGCGSRSSFREVACLRFTPRRVPTHSDPHAFSLCSSACAGQNAPPSGSLARPRPGSGRPGLAFFPPRCFVPLHLPGTRTGPEAASSLYTWGRRTGPDASAVTPEPRGPPGGRTRAGVWGRQGTAR